METLMLPFSPRYIVLTICVAVTALLIGIGIVDHKVFGPVLIPMLVFGGLTALGVRDLLQENHAVLRNYPISAHPPFLSSRNAAGAGRTDGRRGARTSAGIAADPFLAAEFYDRGAVVRQTASVASPWRVDRRHQRSALPGSVDDGAGGHVRGGELISRS